MRPSLVGRERELAAALERLEAHAMGPGALAIEGEAGIGKSALWQLTVTAARERGLPALEARPSEAERTLSYAALGDLLRAELDGALDALPAPQRRALEIALLLADPAGAGPDPRAVAVATLGALQALSAEHPLALAIDDVQWLDADSARALTFALRRLRDEPVLVLVARRGDRSAVLPLGLDAWEDARVLRVRLDPLGPTAVHALLTERLGLRLARPLLLRVHAAAAGNPLYALELGRALMRDEGRLAPTAALPQPETLEGVVAERLAGLSPAAQSALATVAALAHPKPALVTAVEPAGTEGLEQALESGLLQLEDDRVRLSHPLFGSVATARLRPEARRALHRRLAGLVEDFEQRALHVALAAEAPDPEAALVVAEAARRAGARGAPDAALQLAEHALRLGPALGAELSVEASDFAFAAGDTERAGRLLSEALTGAEPARRSAALTRLATLATYDGSMLEARDLGEQALSEAPDDAPARLLIHRRLALANLLLGRLRTAEEHARTAVELASDGKAEAPLARALAVRGLTASEQTGQSTERSVLLYAKALAEAHLGEADACRESAVEGLVIAERAEHRFAASQNRWALGHLELACGRADEAWAALEPALAQLRESEVGEPGVVPVHSEAIEALVMLGETGRAGVLVEEFSDAARWPWLSTAALRCRGLWHAAEGDTDAALRELTDAVEQHRALDAPFALGRTLLALGSAQRRAKQRGAARASLAEAEAAFVALGAEQWAQRARGEAGRLAGRRPGGGHDDELTAAERSVAELAAAGRSNKEIAGELFISERTVEANLTRAYRKLGVRSRTELARRLPAA